MNTFMKVLLAILIAWNFASCNTNTVPELSGDVYYMARATAEGTVFALGFQALSNVDMTSASVESQLDPGVSFSLVMSYGTYFYYEPDESEYTTEVPSPDDFIFTAQLSDGESLSATDQLQDDYLNPVRIVSSDFQSDESLLADWDETENAGLYQVRLVNETGSTVYLSQSISNETTSYTITAGNGEWINGYTPSNGEGFTLQVLAFLLDYTDTSKLQAVSIAGTTLTWQN
jgi:hypothetical protein